MGTGREADRESDLQRALDCGELVRLYEPIVELSSGTPRFVETLVRWRHPTDGELAPRDFLPDDDALLLSHRVVGGHRGDAARGRVAARVSRRCRSPSR